MDSEVTTPTPPPQRSPELAAIAGGTHVDPHRILGPHIVDGAGFAKAIAKRLEQAGAALDVGAYRDAPPGLRVWCGATVELEDVEAMLPWLDWAFDEARAALRRS